MDKRKRTRYRRMLEEKQRVLESLLARAGEAGRGADLTSPEDSAQRAADSSAKELAFSQGDTERLQLLLVNEALTRSKSRDFGLCQGCGEAINPKRLDAVPWAAFCHACQQEEEGWGGPDVAPKS